ncbi:LAMI_0H12992g1_1 [Lachancea mirantina]|uniref:DNA-(apurinic or apyrimidinic site) endonuclease 2 n=1 Tax=Lachancea mirantina TaxID=1230905 RepID=A0A1G4KHS9_9SACH|nr:LAMI_0H12992g1_1 [Lachancea mirantina]
MTETHLESKSLNDIRFLTFNVNGIRTLFNYHPFDEMESSLYKVFDYLKSDIITFQELKTENTAITKWGRIPGFYSFISIPKKKKGYSGVGCWIRIPDQADPLYNILRVVKAEEGLTGYLSVKRGKGHVRYKDDDTLGIGGYESLGIENEQDALILDSDGRCVMVELACNIVVISTYCPANSSLSDSGEDHRLKFLRVLFRRIKAIIALGKQVVLMGDINVCRDLIDHAEGLEKSGIRIGDWRRGNDLEAANPSAVRDFIFEPSRVGRRLLNEILADSVIPELASHGHLVDTTRHAQGRDRLKLYTVWNTLKNSRLINYGSRVDYILMSKGLRAQISQGNIWPQVLGSDHCPIFCDLNTAGLSVESAGQTIPIPRFEARYKYGLNHGDISILLPACLKRSLPEKTVSPAPKRLNLAKKAQQTSIDSMASKSFAKTMALFGDEPPLCRHNEKAVLRTSKTSNNPGKRFWVCSRPKGETGDPAASCGFFEWKQKP